MNANSIKTPVVHPELKHLIQPPISKDPSKIMEVAPKDDCGYIIGTWNGYLLCDVAIYKACISSSLSYKIIDYAFSTIDEAGVFLCESQLRRKDLTNSFRKYLIGKCFGFEQNICRSKSNDTSSKYRIAYKIGDTQNLSGGAVLKYNAFSAAIDFLLKNEEEFGKLLLMEQIKVSHENTIELSRLTPNELKHLASSATEQRLRHLTYQDIRHEVKEKHPHEKSGKSRNERRGQKNSSPISIRQMPAYNPDADVNSLCMTIGSWVSSMERVNQSVDFSSISSKAMIDLVRQLTILEQTAAALQKSLAERDVK